MDLAPAPQASFSFKEVVDETCDRLWDRRVRYTIRRIRTLEDALNTLDLELERWIKNMPGYS